MGGAAKLTSMPLPGISISPMPISTRSSVSADMDAAKTLLRFRYQHAPVVTATRGAKKAAPAMKRPQRACANYTPGMYQESDD